MSITLWLEMGVRGRMVYRDIFMRIEDHFLSIAFHVLSYVTTVLLSSVYQINLWELGAETEVYVAAANRFFFPPNLQHRL